MMRKLIDFKGLDEDIQKYANKYYNGNFNKAVREIIKGHLEDKE